MWQYSSLHGTHPLEFAGHIHPGVRQHQRHPHRADLNPSSAACCQIKYLFAPTAPSNWYFYTLSRAPGLRSLRQQSLVAIVHRQDFIGQIQLVCLRLDPFPKSGGARAIKRVKSYISREIARGGHENWVGEGIPNGGYGAPSQTGSRR